MSRFHLISAAPLLLALAGCVAPPMPTVPAPADTCGRAQYAGLVGAPLSTFNASQVKGPVRILAPGAVMTMDHRPDRLNIYHNARGIVQQVTCG